MTGAAPAPHPAPQQIEVIVEHILGRPEFHGLEPSWWERLLQTGSQTVRGLAESAHTLYVSLAEPVARWAADQPGWIVDVGAAVAAGLAGALVVFGIRGIRRKWVGDARLSPDTAQLQETRKKLATELSPRAVRRRATRALNTGNARESVRILYEAALDRLSSEGAIRLSPHSTHRDYLTEAGALSASRRASFGKVVALYERVWYGRQFATAADIDYGIRCVTSLLE